jgi:hypothetical protein
MFRNCKEEKFAPTGNGKPIFHRSVLGLETTVPELRSRQKINQAPTYFLLIMSEHYNNVDQTILCSFSECIRMAPE